MIQYELTGRRRYREHKTWTGKFIVLQVQERQYGDEDISAPDEIAPHCRRIDRLVWRDATTEDLTEFGHGISSL